MSSATKKERATEVLKGIGVSPGVVVGPVFVFARKALAIPERQISEEEIDDEVARLEDALIETRRQISRAQRDLESRTARADASLLDAHLMVLDDRSLVEEIVERIRGKHKNVEAAVKSVTDRYASVLAAVEDEYLRERVSDVRDVARRILENLSGESVRSFPEIPLRHIIVAVDLAPSETAMLRKDMVTGFATDVGSPTSHTAVLARALEIPAVVGLHDVTQRAATGDELLIDGNKGVLIVNPSAAQLEQYGKVAAARRTIERGLDNLKEQPAVTRDGHRVILSANTETLEEIDAVLHYGAEGVGLFRSEYLYLIQDRVVGEEEQAEAYGTVARRLAPSSVIIRTLDLGGDKFCSDGRFHREANPFLGCRSIRFSLQHPEEFKSQLRAILRASAAGNVKIMYPMISGVEEVRQANALLEEAKKELAAANVPFQRDIEVGVMIEIPAAALTADAIAEHVKFFSLGTNDLIQYTLAVDRVNERVAYLYVPTHPAVLQLMQRTVEAGHRHGIWVGLCGEMGSEPVLTPLLVGMGLDELSVPPAAVPLVKDAIRSIEYARARELAATALSCPSAEEVLHLCRRLMEEAAPELLELV